MTIRQSNPPAAPPSGPARRVLVIDDDLDMQRLLSQAIRSNGCEPACFIDGQEGLRRYPELNPVMVCLDLMLPNLSGFEICRRIRAAGGTMPVVAISARDLPEDEVNAMQAGFDMFISKPVRLPDVTRLLAGFLNPPAGA